MEEAVANNAAVLAPPSKKSSTTLSVDRAAFLLLRVKKAFKRKRQQRKDKQQQSGAANAAAAATAGAAGRNLRLNQNKVPPPLLRSRTLPAIIVPGLPIASLHTDKTRVLLDEKLNASNNKIITNRNNRDNRCSLLLTRNPIQSVAICCKNHHNNNNNNSNNNNNNNKKKKNHDNFNGESKATTIANINNKISNDNKPNNNNNNNKKSNNNNNTLSLRSLNIPKDDAISIIYRRKSSGSTPNPNTNPSSSSNSVDLTKLPANYKENYYHYNNDNYDNNDDHYYYNNNDYDDNNYKYLQDNANVTRTSSISDDCPCYASDGSVLLRIPAPDAVTARVYRLPTRKTSTSSTSCTSFDSNNRLQGDYQIKTLDNDQDAGVTTMGDNDGSISTTIDSNIAMPECSMERPAATGRPNQNTLSNINFTRRFAKLLHQSCSSNSGCNATTKSASAALATGGSIKNVNGHNPLAFLTTTIHNSSGNEAPRRLSWERRKDSSALQRSASIDSYAEIVWNEMPQASSSRSAAEAIDDGDSIVPMENVRKLSSISSTSSTMTFSKRPSTSSLYSTTASTIGGGTGFFYLNTTINGNNNNSNATIPTTTTTTTGGGRGVTIINANANAKANAINRRESLLSPSASRRNKMTRVVNDIY